MNNWLSKPLELPLFLTLCHKLAKAGEDQTQSVIYSHAKKQWEKYTVTYNSDSEGIKCHHQPICFHISSDIAWLISRKIYVIARDDAQILVYNVNNMKFGCLDWSTGFGQFRVIHQQ